MATGHEAGLSPALIFNSRETTNYTINIIFYSVRFESNGSFIFSQRHKFPLGSCDEEHPASNYHVFSFSWFSAQPGVSVLQAIRKNPDLRVKPFTLKSGFKSDLEAMFIFYLQSVILKTHNSVKLQRELVHPQRRCSSTHWFRCSSRKLLMEIKFVARQHRPKCSLLENNLLVAQQHYLIGCAWRR